jgi:hypothetical protein
MTYFTQGGWKRWLEPDRLVPAGTLLAAAAVSALSLVGVIKVSKAEGVIIGLLTLLAADSLVERIRILDRLESRLREISPKVASLRARKDMPKLHEHAMTASEICISAVHGSSVILPNGAFFERKIREGCRVRIVLLDPTSPSVDIWNRISKRTYTRAEIEGSLGVLATILENTSPAPNFEVRLIDVLLPFSMFGVDLSKPTGSIIAEHQCYNVAADDRPHVRVLPAESPYWFEYYRMQFEDIFSDAKPWQPGTNNAV